MGLLISLMMCILLTIPAIGADFANRSTPRAGLNYIELSGSILPNDYKKFQNAIERAPPIFTVIVLESPGGDVAAALAIGREIRRLGYSTLVKAGAVCASACALIWLAGDDRYMARGARIGFHAAFAVDGDNLIERGLPNALIGAYLNQLELSDTAIVFVTRARPTNLAWLDVLTAMHIGINFKVPDEDGK